MGNRIYAAESTTKSVICPHCNAEYPDDWECLELDQLSRMRCSECKKDFAFYLAQCIRCAEESIFVWASQPSPYWRALLLCQSCGEPSYDFVDETKRSTRIR
jgi:hypothetical protein